MSRDVDGWLTLLTMSVVAAVLAGLTPVLPQLVTGVCAVTAGVGGVVLTQRYNDRQRARERVSAANAKVEETTRELFEAVSELHLALSTYQPVHNTWQPRLMVLGSAFLEFMAAKETGRFALGVAQAGRIAVEENQRGLLAAQELKVPLQRVMAAAARAALLPDSTVRAAALRLGGAAAEAGRAYGQDNLWRRQKATAAREQADAELFAALAALVDAAGTHLHPQDPPRRGWPSRVIQRRRRADRSDAVVLAATVPPPRGAAHDAVPAAAVPALPAGRQPAAMVAVEPARRP